MTTAIKHPVPDRRTERQSARMSNITNDGLTRSGTCFIAGWLGGTTGSASDQRSEGCGFEAY